MFNFRLNIEECQEDSRMGLAAIAASRPSRFEPNGIQLRFIHDGGLVDGGNRTVDGQHGIEVRYGRRIDAFRALGRLLGAGEWADCHFEESAKFSTLGILVDVSRNGVLTIPAAKKLIAHCALMGINLIMFYTEDTYEIPGERFFGYLRGRYTRSELEQLDDYANALGIELVPCIQTLAHLEQVLQWPAYADYRDRDGILIAGEEKTYALIEQMIVAASSPFRSRRIHIGMDEAHGLGTGRYKTLHGDQRPAEIMREHLRRVNSICAKHGLRPMIWSDMYFHDDISSDAYSKEIVITKETKASISDGIDLVGWFYGGDLKEYEYWIKRHRELTPHPIIAGGLLTWNRFWAHLPSAIGLTQACMDACKNEAVSEVFTTLWADDGAECDPFSALPGLQFFAEHGYADQVSAVRLRANFQGGCDADFDDWVRAADLDALPDIRYPLQFQREDGKTAGNPSKWLLWQDPLLSLMDPRVEGIPLREHFERLSSDLFSASTKMGGNTRLLFPALIARALSLKCDLRRTLAEAYSLGDQVRLGNLLKEDLPMLLGAVRELWLHHRNLWLEAYKPFGLEVLEQRYGGLLARLESLSLRLGQYLTGGDDLPELAAGLEKVFDDMQFLSYNRVATPSFTR